MLVNELKDFRTPIAHSICSLGVDNNMVPAVMGSFPATVEIYHILISEMQIKDSSSAYVAPIGDLMFFIKGFGLGR